MDVSISVKQQAMQFPIHMLPTMNGGYNGVPYSALQPVMALPSTERNQVVTSLTAGQALHPGKNHTKTAPTINETYQTVTSLPYSASQPLMALPFKKRNQALTPLQQGHIIYPGMPFTSQAPTMQTPQTSSSQSAGIPIYQVASASTSSRSISAAIHEPTGDRPQRIAKALLNDVGYEESEPFSKRTKHESGAAYKPGGINFPNFVITELTEYK